MTVEEAKARHGEAVARCDAAARHMEAQTVPWAGDDEARQRKDAAVAAHDAARREVEAAGNAVFAAMAGK